MTKLCNLFCLLGIVCVSIALEPDNRPVKKTVIGILVHPASSSTNAPFTSKRYERMIKYHNAGYNVEIVPVFSEGQPGEYYDWIFQRINGLLIPGGSVNSYKGPYALTGAALYDKAVTLQDATKEKFPIWGTCLGFQLLASKANDMWPANVRTDIDKITYMNLDFSDFIINNRSQSWLFHDAPENVMSELANETRTPHSHCCGILTSEWESNENLQEMYYNDGTNVDKLGKEIVSMFEGKKYPFIGTQFHIEFYSGYKTATAKWITEKFLHAANENSHSFDSEEQLTRLAIGNYVIEDYKYMYRDIPVYNATALNELM